MDFKLVGGITAGIAVGGGIAYILHRNSLRKTEDMLRAKHTHEIKKLTNDHNKNVSQLTKQNTEYANTIRVYKSAINVYRNLSDVDMLADITRICDREGVDSCLDDINALRINIDDILSYSLKNISDTEMIDNVIENIADKEQETMDGIKVAIQQYEEIIDDDDDDDEISLTPDDEETISPKRVILTGINCESIIFDADPDEGFEVLDGSDTENNDYCIVAQNIPKLYRVLFNSIYKQLSEHYLSKIDRDVFDAMLDDMVITISLSFVNETDAVITAVNAVVPFELFAMHATNNTMHVYSIKEGEISNNDVIRYFRSSCSDNDLSSKQEDPVKNSCSKEMVNETPKQLDPIDTRLTDENIQFIIDTVGYNRDSLKSFAGKLETLCRVNPEAGSAIQEAVAEIISDVYNANLNGTLSEDEKLRIANMLRTLISNMKKHYGSAIKYHSQNN